MAARDSAKLSADLGSTRPAALAWIAKSSARRLRVSRSPACFEPRQFQDSAVERRLHGEARLVIEQRLLLVAAQRNLEFGVANLGLDVA